VDEVRGEETGHEKTGFVLSFLPDSFFSWEKKRGRAKENVICECMTGQR
jgi:hypothetical protein